MILPWSSFAAYRRHLINFLFIYLFIHLLTTHDAKQSKWINGDTDCTVELIKVIWLKLLLMVLTKGVGQKPRDQSWAVPRLHIWNVKALRRSWNAPECDDEFPFVQTLGQPTKFRWHDSSWMRLHNLDFRGFSTYRKRLKWLCSK